MRSFAPLQIDHEISHLPHVFGGELREQLAHVGEIALGERRRRLGRTVGLDVALDGGKLVVDFTEQLLERVGDRSRPRRLEQRLSFEHARTRRRGGEVRPGLRRRLFFVRLDARIDAWHLQDRLGLVLLPLPAHVHDTRDDDGRRCGRLDWRVGHRRSWRMRRRGRCRRRVRLLRHFSAPPLRHRAREITHRPSSTPVRARACERARERDILSSAVVMRGTERSEESPTNGA